MAGTINTTNYGFKKYAPEDTVSVLQTFNGNMDGIDTAIKARQDENTVTAANVQKVEQGLTNVNEAINTTNNTVAAQNVQIQTNKQNIESQGLEIERLDNRVQSLEDGGQEITKLVLSSSANVDGYYATIISQGKHISGNGIVHESAASGTVFSGTWKNWNGTNPYNTSPYGPLFTIAGNIFNSTENEILVIGSDNVGLGTLTPSDEAYNFPLIAQFNGVNTTIYAYTNITKPSSHAINIDYVL